MITERYHKPSFAARYHLLVQLFARGFYVNIRTPAVYGRGSQLPLHKCRRWEKLPQDEWHIPCGCYRQAGFTYRSVSVDAPPHRFGFSQALPGAPNCEAKLKVRNSRVLLGFAT